MKRSEGWLRGAGCALTWGALAYFVGDLWLRG